MSYLSKVLSFVFSLCALAVAEGAFQSFLVLSLMWACIAVIQDHKS